MRDLQRRYSAAVLLVHHARKSSSSDPGLGLRGSSEIRAWSDSSLYMRRNKGLELIVEHRGAPAPEPLRLVLTSDEPANTHLAIEGEALAPATTPPDLGERIVELLRTSTPLSRDDIRRRLAVRNQATGAVLAALTQDGVIEKCSIRLPPHRHDDQIRPVDTDALLGSTVVTPGRLTRSRGRTNGPAGAPGQPGALFHLIRTS